VFTLFLLPFYSSCLIYLRNITKDDKRNLAMSNEINDENMQLFALELQLKIIGDKISATEDDPELLKKLSQDAGELQKEIADLKTELGYEEIVANGNVEEEVDYTNPDFLNEVCSIIPLLLIINSENTLSFIDEFIIPNIGRIDISKIFKVIQALSEKMHMHEAKEICELVIANGIDDTTWTEIITNQLVTCLSLISKKEPKNIQALFEFIDYDKKNDNINRNRIIKLYEKAQEIQPNNIELKTRLADEIAANDLMNNMHDPDNDKSALEKAENLYQEAIALDPDRAHTFYLYGNFLAKHSREDRAKKQYDKAIEIDEDYPDPYLQKAVIDIDAIKVWEEGKDQLANDAIKLLETYFSKKGKIHLLDNDQQKMVKKAYIFLVKAKLILTTEARENSQDLTDIMNSIRTIMGYPDLGRDEKSELSRIADEISAIGNHNRNTNPEFAKKMFQFVIEMFGDDDFASYAVKSAKDELKSISQ